jgi:nifR3 family TIM-barrel protein
MLKIGNIELDVPFYQAPLSGYSEWPMRVLAREFGCPLAFTGVLLDKIALHPKAVRKLKFQPDEDEHPVGAQILGANPETMAQAAAGFERVGFDIIDLNFACPAPKVLRRKRGGYQLNEPDIVIETIRRVREAVRCPVSMKLRAGFDSSAESIEKFWEICERAHREGIDAMTIHGRTVTRRYRGKADWRIGSEVKKRFADMTVFGSGDLLAPETIVHRIRTSGLDGVLIARGAIGNPWIFREARALLAGQDKPAAPSLAEQAEVMLRHFEMMLEVRPDRKAVPFFRKFAAGYCKRHPQRKQVLLAIMAAKTGDQLRATINEWYGTRGDTGAKDGL